MAKRILTPIDGRQQSATIVPVVAALARGAGSTVRLLKVFPVPERVAGPNGRTIAYVDQEMSRLTAAGLDELAQVEAELEGIPVERVVRFGEPAEEIRLEAEAFNADLVALATSRRGRLRSALAELSELLFVFGLGARLRLLRARLELRRLGVPAVDACLEIPDVFVAIHGLTSIDFAFHADSSITRRKPMCDIGLYGSEPRRALGRYDRQ